MSDYDARLCLNIYLQGSIISLFCIFWFIYGEDLSTLQIFKLCQYGANSSVLFMVKLNVFAIYIGIRYMIICNYSFIAMALLHV